MATPFEDHYKKKFKRFYDARKKLPPLTEKQRKVFTEPLRLLDEYAKEASKPDKEEALHGHD